MPGYDNMYDYLQWTKNKYSTYPERELEESKKKKPDTIGDDGDIELNLGLLSLRSFKMYI